MAESEARVSGDLLASQPKVPDDLVRIIFEAKSAPNLLRDHAGDASGHCPRCPAGGASSGRVTAPCTLFLAAVAAMQLRARGSTA